MFNVQVTFHKAKALEAAASINILLLMIIWWKFILEQVLSLNRIEMNKFMIPMTFEAITSYSMDDSMSLNYVYSITLVLMSELSNSSLEIGGPVLGVQWLRAVSANSIRAHNGLDNSDSSRDKLPPPGGGTFCSAEQTPIGPIITYKGHRDLSRGMVDLNWDFHQTYLQDLLRKVVRHTVSIF